MTDNIFFYYYLFVVMATSDIAAKSAPNHCSRRSADEEKPVIQPLNEMILARDSLKPDALNMDVDPTESIRKVYGGLLPLPIILNDDELKSFDNQKAFACSQLPCNPGETVTPVCACNYKTGNVITFKNECELKKHNCRFDTDFHVILQEICPWEFLSRRGTEILINYDDPKFYN